MTVIRGNTGLLTLRWTLWAAVGTSRRSWVSRALAVQSGWSVRGLSTTIAVGTGRRDGGSPGRFLSIPPGRYVNPPTLSQLRLRARRESGDRLCLEPCAYGLQDPFAQSSSHTLRNERDLFRDTSKLAYPVLTINTETGTEESR